MRKNHTCIYKANGMVGGQLWAVYQDLRAESIGQVSVRCNGREMMRATRRSWDEYISGQLLDDATPHRYICHILRDKLDALVSVHERYFPMTSGNYWQIDEDESLYY